LARATPKQLAKGGIVVVEQDRCVTCGAYMGPPATHPVNYGYAASVCMNCNAAYFDGIDAKGLSEKQLDIEARRILNQVRTFKMSKKTLQREREEYEFTHWTPEKMRAFEAYAEAEHRANLKLQIDEFERTAHRALLGLRVGDPEGDRPMNLTTNEMAHLPTTERADGRLWSIDARSATTSALVVPEPCALVRRVHAVVAVRSRSVRPNPTDPDVCTQCGMRKVGTVNTIIENVKEVVEMGSRPGDPGVPTPPVRPQPNDPNPDGGDSG
jgi:hypothetical protein